MTLLSQMVRIAKDEEIILNDAGPYNQGAVADWATQVTENVVLDKIKMIFIRVQATAAAGVHGAARVLVDSVPVLSTGGLEPTESGDVYVFLELDTLPHTIEFQTSVWVTGGNNLSMDLCYVGAFNFKDQQATLDDSGSMACPGLSTTKVLEFTHVLEAARETPVGDVLEHSAIVVVYAENVGSRTSKMKNPGDANEANYLNWKLYIDGAQVSFEARKNDVTSNPANDSFGEGAYGLYRAQWEPGSTKTIKVYCYNGFAPGKNVRVVVAVFSCPWVIPASAYVPVELDELPQGSTIYVTLEPFTLNPTKDIKLGKERFVSFGDADDYYATGSGADILEFSYTFDTIESDKVILVISGEFGCISQIGVDEA